MDITRKHDIEQLQKALKDPTVPELYKKKAYRSLEKIKRQEELPWLHEERMRLLKARRANDQRRADYIAHSIKRRMQEEDV
jgi:hypothetical protein